MDHPQTLDVPPFDDRFPYYETEVLGDDASKPLSKYTPPIYIEMGDEDGELLESYIKEKTNETVGAIKADVDWIRLKGTRSIDTSVVAGFMFQTDSGTGCSITITENENRPIRILIDETQGFAIFLVVVLRHEKWTTSGLFHLRFVRRVPISAKKCTARMDEPVVTSSGSGTSSGEKPMSVADDSRDIEEDGELASAPKGGKLASATKDLRDIEEWMEQTAAALNEENGATGDTDQVAFTNDSHMVPLSRQPEDSKDGDTTDEEDWRAIGADARIMPANWRPPAN